jgi:protease IV
MSLNADTLIDRSYLKGQITKWRLIAISVIVLSVILLTQSANAPLMGMNHIARVSVEGIISDDKRRDELFAELEEDTSVQAVIVRMDSPGGTVVGGEQLYLNIKSLSEKKPVVVLMRSLATSAGYMATLGADRIYAREGTLTGSIGVIMQTAEVTELAERLGINPITIKSGVNKASPNPLEKMTEENRAVLERVVMGFYDTFVSMVATERGLEREQVLALADGSVFTGPQALEAGLIDAIGGEKEAIQWLETEKQITAELDVRDREPAPERPKSLAGFFEQMAKSFAFLPQIRLDGLVSIWQPKSM